MDSKLLPLIRTTNEVNQLVQELELLKKSIFEHGNQSFHSTLNGNVRAWVAEIIKEELGENDKEDYLNNLLVSINGLEEFKITLAFEPTNTGINMLLDFLRQNVNPNLIIDLELDPSILGGAIISYKGKYHDFSFSKLFDKEFQEKKEQFMQIFEKNIDSSG